MTTQIDRINKVAKMVGKRGQSKEDIPDWLKKDNEDLQEGYWPAASIAVVRNKRGDWDAMIMEGAESGEVAGETTYIDRNLQTAHGSSGWEALKKLAEAWSNAGFLE